jgi:LemA protein
VKKIWLILGGVVLLLVILIGSCVSRYNTLVTAEEDIAEKWAQVENVLQRRADLLPNLVEVVKGYAAHEKEIFKDVADARSRLLAAKGPAEVAGANAGMSSALGRLLAISENYPDLKANENFTRLQDELAGTENRIAVERKRYNDAVGTFNKSIKTFPNSVLAGMANLQKQEYFEAEAGAKEVPKVSFE